MKTPTITEKKLIERLIKSEYEKVFGPWPKGMTLEDWGRYQLYLFQEDEARKAFHTLCDKQLAVSQSEIKKADSDPHWSFFWGIGTASNRDLQVGWVKDRIHKAIKQNDLKFFVRLGNALKQKPRQLSLDKVAFTLAARWTTWVGKIPPLSFFTDQALLDMLKILTGNEMLTFDQVRKTRQRLGLKLKDVKIKEVKLVGTKGESFRLVWVDKGAF
jgi:hypothetical protein